VRARQQAGGVREAQRLADAQPQQFSPFDNELSSSFASILTTKDFVQDFCVRKTGFACSFDQTQLVGKAHTSAGDNHKVDTISVKEAGGFFGARSS
jgi:hypothetical protein